MFKTHSLYSEIKHLFKLKTVSFKSGTQIWVNCHKSFLYIYLDIHVYETFQSLILEGIVWLKVSPKTWHFCLLLIFEMTLNHYESYFFPKKCSISSLLCRSINIAKWIILKSIQFRAAAPGHSETRLSPFYQILSSNSFGKHSINQLMHYLLYCVFH